MEDVGGGDEARRWRSGVVAPNPVDAGAPPGFHEHAGGVDGAGGRPGWLGDGDERRCKKGSPWRDRPEPKQPHWVISIAPTHHQGAPNARNREEVDSPALVTKGGVCGRKGGNSKLAAS